MLKRGTPNPGQCSQIGYTFPRTPTEPIGTEPIGTSNREAKRKMEFTTGDRLALADILILIREATDEAWEVYEKTRGIVDHDIYKAFDLYWGQLPAHAGIYDQEEWEAANTPVGRLVEGFIEATIGTDHEPVGDKILDIYQRTMKVDGLKRRCRIYDSKARKLVDLLGTLGGSEADLYRLNDHDLDRLHRALSQMTELADRLSDLKMLATQETFYKAP